MFEISWSELLVLAVVTLIFLGPKDYPVFFNTLGRYAGALRRQADEFKRYFDEAMREAEMDSLRKELDSVREDVLSTVRDAERAADQSVKNAEAGVRSAASSAKIPAEAKPGESAPSALPAPEAGENKAYQTAPQDAAQKSGA